MKSSYQRTIFKHLVFFLFTLLFCQCQKDDDDDDDDIIVESINKNTSSTFLVKETYLSDFERNRLMRNLGISDFIPTGLFLKPGNSIEVTQILLSGNHIPNILLGSYSRNLWTDSPIEYVLSNTSMTITNNSSKNANIFIRYASDSPNSESNVTITGGQKSPFFIYNTTTNSEFINMLVNYSYSDIVLSSEKATVIASRQTALKYKDQNWNLLLQTINEILDQEAYIDGLDGSSLLHIPNRNKYYFTESNDSNYWMAATSYRTFYNSNNAIDFLIDVNTLKNNGWGPWHELGHQHQISSLTWSKTVEVTTNIYSLAVERNFGHSSRLLKDNVWSSIDNYFNSPIEERNYNADSQLGPFERLGMYQQLWLKYSDEFFIKLHRKAREEKRFFDTDEKKMSYFILKASEVAENNLNNFFKAWGLILPQSSFDAVDILNLPVPSEDLTLLRE